MSSILSFYSRAYNMSDTKPTPPSFSFKLNPAAPVLFGNVTLEDIMNGTVLTSTQMNEIAIDDEPSNNMTNNDSEKKSDTKDDSDKQ